METDAEGFVRNEDSILAMTVLCGEDPADEGRTVVVVVTTAELVVVVVVK